MNLTPYAGLPHSFEFIKDVGFYGISVIKKKKLKTNETLQTGFFFTRRESSINYLMRLQTIEKEMCKLFLTAP